MKISLLPCLLVLAPLVACGGSDTSGGGGGGSGTTCTADNATKTTSVSLQGSAFSPDCILVDQGATVTFTNADGFDHQIVGGGGDTGNLAGGASGTITFDSAGSVDINCTIHPSMVATVIVQ
jgi:plastocyanin